MATDPDTAARGIQALLDLPDTGFAELLDGSLNRKLCEDRWDLLLSPELVRRTHEHLQSRFRDLEDQLAQRNAGLDSFRQECFARGPEGKQEWFDAVGEHNEWRQRALRYRRTVNGRLGEAKAALRRAAPAPTRVRSDPTKRARQIKTVFELGWAIRRHRERMLAEGIAPDDHDVDLWHVLDDELVATEYGTVTVAEFLDDLASKPGFVPPEDRV